MDPPANVIVLTNGVFRYIDTFGWDFQILLMTRAHLMIGFLMRLMLVNSCVFAIRIRCFTIHCYGQSGLPLRRIIG